MLLDRTTMELNLGTSAASSIVIGQGIRTFYPTLSLWNLVSNIVAVTFYRQSQDASTFTPNLMHPTGRFLVPKTNGRGGPARKG